MSNDTVYLVCGGRDFKDTALMDRTLAARPVKAIVQGGAKGADRLAKTWARRNGIPEIEVNAPWTFYGSKAGPLRNSWMLELIQVDVVLAFPGGRGTADMVRKAQAAGVLVKEIPFET